MKKIICVLAILFSHLVSSHPGRTASDGCHYCRTNCTKWGVPWGERHCHRRVDESDLEKLLGELRKEKDSIVNVLQTHQHKKSIR